MSLVERYARYRAPDESGQKLFAPAWSEMGELLAANVRWRASADVGVLGQALSHFTSAARREILERSAAYVGAYAKVPDQHFASEMPLIVTGHQPDLFHPGVWLKNFAAAALAEQLGARALHLVIDADACRTTSIRVPTGRIDDVQLALVQFDQPAPETPWEERRIFDNDSWQSFGQRVRKATAPLLAERFLDQWWPLATERGRATNRLGAGLSQARHLAEQSWGRRNFELPQSEMCQTEAFRRFACHLLRDLPRLFEAYNGALADYRRRHRLRNHAQPVPDLETDSTWLEAPFWIWSTANPQRRRLFLRHQRGELVLSDRNSLERSLPLAPDGDPAEAIAELSRWEALGVKLRSRALITTMFSRLALADLFIHGIGGAKYDEATDAVCERFFGTAPPPYATLSGTLRLPIYDGGGAAVNPRPLRHLLRQLTFHPERYVDPRSAPAADRVAIERLIIAKRDAISTSKTSSNAISRHHAIASANLGLQPFLTASRADAEKQLAVAAAQFRSKRITDSREYAFCLFPKSILERFLLEFPQRAL